MKRYAFILFGFMAFLTVLAAGAVPAAAQETYTATPVADAWVRSDQPNNTFNTFNLLYYDSVGSTEYYSFMRFGERPAAAAAELNLYVSLNNAHLRLVDSGYFDEKSVTYSNAPPLGFVFVSSHTITSTGYTQIDITDWWNNGGESLAILSEPNENVATYLGSSEYAAQKPFVEYELVPTATPMPTAVPPEPEPQLIHCYDFQSSGADFIGGADITVPAGWSYTTALDGNGLTGGAGSANATYDGLNKFTISFWLDDEHATVMQSSRLWVSSVGQNSNYLASLPSGFVPIATNDGISDTVPGFHHYALTANGSEFTLYRDGSQINTTTQYPSNLLDQLSVVTQGTLDALSIYSGVTDPAALYAAGPLACVDQVDPTAVTMTRIDLPSGGRAFLSADITAGEALIAGVLTILTGAVLLLLAYGVSRKAIL